MNKLQPIYIVIFGAKGDLSKRKLIPAIYDLFLDNKLSGQISILGIDHANWTQLEFTDYLKKSVAEFSRHAKNSSSKTIDEEYWNRFSSSIKYMNLDFVKRETYDLLKDLLSFSLSYLFYLAVAPGFVEEIVNNLNRVGFLSNKETRVVVEKPFGHDLDSASKLNETLTRFLDESQIFRIDHYLGKETVQNILALRFGNSLFEPLWNRNYIDNVQITVFEDKGIENRGSYYDKSGALIDMIENHLFQLLCLIAMEPPIQFNKREFQNKMLNVLYSVREIPRDQVLDFAARGQYQNYRNDPKVDPNSQTETFAALKIFIDNWRWQDIPFYLRTGKKMAKQIAEISLQFRSVPHQTFPNATHKMSLPNKLIIRIQPEESIILRFQVKKPGTQFELHPVDMRFCYNEFFFGNFPNAYETLLTDIIEGDGTLFVSAQREKAAWSILAPILEEWKKDSSDLQLYEEGSSGPSGATDLLNRDNKSWNLTANEMEEKGACQVH